jgi:twitching motility two-component system response regulator PilH
MRLTLITMLVATMLVACGSLNTTQATNSDGTAVQATSASQSDATVSNTKNLKGGVIKRVLVVDSKTGSSSMIEDLTKSGFLVSHVENSEQTMQFLNESAADALPDVMLIEVVLPGMNGYELTLALSRDKRYQRIPIIMVTSQQEETAKIRALISRFQFQGRPASYDYMTKPVDVDELMWKIKVLNK